MNFHFSSKTDLWESRSGGASTDWRQSVFPPGEDEKSRLHTTVAHHWERPKFNVAGPTRLRPTGAHHFLWVYCPACRTARDIDLRALDRHRDAAVTSLILLLSCRSCRPHAPFAQLVRLSKTSIADEMRIEHTRRVLGE
jgi:hypothetical protein